LKLTLRLRIARLTNGAYTDENTTSLKHVLVTCGNGCYIAAAADCSGLIEAARIEAYSVAVDVTAQLVTCVLTTPIVCARLSYLEGIG